jgi:DDE_Tnp_1-associated
VTETSIHRHFKQLDDPRLDRRKKYPLLNLIFIAFCAVLCGAEDWVSITRFGKARFNWLSQFLDLTNNCYGTWLNNAKKPQIVTARSIGKK